MKFPEVDFRELAVLAHNSEKQLGLPVTALCALGPDSSSGLALELCGKRRSYQVRITPQDGVTLSTGQTGGQSKQVFYHSDFDHRIAGELFRTIKAQEKNNG
jgi:hypothetical protein